MALDLAISLDTTGSMYSCLVEARRRISHLCGEISKHIPDFRIAIIAHGDYHDVYETKQIDFTTNVEDLQSFVTRVEKTSGFGNGGECYEYVFHKVSQLNWKADKRIYVMVGDEPPHIKDQLVYTKWGRRSLRCQYDWREENQNLTDIGVLTYPVRCLNRNDSRKFHTELADLNEVPLLHLHQFSNLVELLIAVSYKQESDEILKEYGENLQDAKKLNRNLAHILNLLLNAKDLVGGLVFEEKDPDLEAVDPTRFQILHVDNTCSIKDFVTKSGATFKVGRGFYKLTKRETIQEKKEVVLRNEQGDMFTGEKAREMIGLPYGKRGKISPPTNLDYDVFVQSTSWNRKLMPNTEFLYEVDMQ